MSGEGAIQRRRLPWFIGFLGRRLAWAGLTLFTFISFLFFFMQAWVPYTWATQFSFGGGDRAVTEALGLNRPLWERYLEFLGVLARGSLGESFAGGPVGATIRDSLPVTLMVFVTGSLIAWVAGELLGRAVAWRRARTLRALMSVGGVLSATVFPPFLVFVLVRWFRFPLLELRSSLGLPVDSLEVWRGAVIGEPGFPTPGQVRWLVALALALAVSVGLAVRALARRRGLDFVSGLALPLCLGAAGAGIWVTGVGVHALDLLFRSDLTVATGRGSPILALLGVVLLGLGQVMFMMRVGIEDERDEDYVLTARAKGIEERLVRDRHVARNALPPVLAGSFLAVPTILAGMFIVELELEMAGLSTVLFDAIEFQDIPMIMGVMVVLGMVGIGLRLLTEFAIAILDPRQRSSR